MLPAHVPIRLSDFTGKVGVGGPGGGEGRGAKNGVEGAAVEERARESETTMTEGYNYGGEVTAIKRGVGEWAGVCVRERVG